MKKCKQSIALLLATTMLSGTMTATAFAGTHGSATNRETTDNTTVYTSGSTEYSYLELEIGGSITLGVRTPIINVSTLNFTNGTAEGFGVNDSRYTFDNGYSFGDVTYSNTWFTYPQTIGNYQFYCKNGALTYKSWDVNVVHTHTVTYETPAGATIGTYSEKQLEESVYPTHDLMDSTDYDAWIVSEVGSLYGGDLEVGDYLELDETVSIQDDITLQGVVTATFSAHEDETWIDAEIRTGVDGSLSAPEEEPKLLGYTFAGWSVGRVVTEFPTEIYEATEYDAAWSTSEYLVTYLDGVETEEIAVPEESTVAYGANVIVSSMIPEYSGYTFDGWSTNFDEAVYYHESEFDMPAQDVTLTANWIKNSSSSTTKSYYIKATATGKGTVAPEDDDVSPDSMYKVTKLSDVTFVFDADAGYEVTDVIVNGKSVGACDEYEFEDIIITMQTLEVVFEKDTDYDEDEDENEEIEEEVEDEEEDTIVLPFTDVDDDHEHFDGIAYVYENGIMAGISEEVFGSELSITRGMIAAILYRMDGSNPVNYAMTFTDVDLDQYYAEAIRWAQANNIVAGYSETEFRPNESITNEQFAAFLYRYASFLDMDTDVSRNADLSDYVDATNITPYAYAAMLWAVEYNIIGDGDLLTPTVPALRGVVATALMNFMEEM
ncbi:S-layer homology domain-containing protein [Chakrabartyella piscis]|uniref:S-layer homology domain-containing protein n=1 Tax=Chakrabartyella piscis TaxID=2918914 RepID=UPI002958A6BE|nr:S-layer homology domain-containing protein [Chakrabartyella piscis]